MSVASLERSLPPGERVLIDTTPLVAYLDEAELITPLAAHVLEQCVFPGRNHGIVSMISVTELLVRPVRVGVSGHYLHVLDFLTRFPNLRALPIDLAVAHEAASLRAMFQFQTADALIIATGLVAQVHHLVTNDADWVRKLQPINSRIRVCLLSHHL